MLARKSQQLTSNSELGGTLTATTRQDSVTMTARPASRLYHVPELLWQLVWCYERSHKPENIEIRRSMQRSVQEDGGSLVCLKKALQFGLWMDRSNRPGFALLTDWREAQPCMQAISQHTGRNRPMLTIVLCDSQRQCIRATAWSQSLGPHVGPVHVYAENDVSPQLLIGIVRQCIGSGGVAWRAPLTVGAEPVAAPAVSVAPFQDFTASCIGSFPEHVGRRRGRVDVLPGCSPPSRPYAAGSSAESRPPWWSSNVADDVQRNGAFARRRALGNGRPSWIDISSTASLGKSLAIEATTIEYGSTAVFETSWQQPTAVTMPPEPHLVPVPVFESTYCGSSCNAAE